MVQPGHDMALAPPEDEKEVEENGGSGEQQEKRFSPAKLGIGERVEEVEEGKEQGGEDDWDENVEEE